MEGTVGKVAKSGLNIWQGLHPSFEMTRSIVHSAGFLLADFDCIGSVDVWFLPTYGRDFRCSIEVAYLYKSTALG